MNCVEYKTEVKQKENGFDVEITYTWNGDPSAREAFEKEMRNYLEGGLSPRLSRCFSHWTDRVSEESGVKQE